MFRRSMSGVRSTVLLVCMVGLSACNKQHPPGEPVPAERESTGEKQSTSEQQSAMTFEGSNAEATPLPRDALRQKQQGKMDNAQAAYEAEPVDNQWALEVAGLLDEQAAIRMPVTA